MVSETSSIFTTYNTGESFFRGYEHKMVFHKKKKRKRETKPQKSHKMVIKKTWI